MRHMPIIAASAMANAIFPAVLPIAVIGEFECPHEVTHLGLAPLGKLRRKQPNRDRSQKKREEWVNPEKRDGHYHDGNADCQYPERPVVDGG